LTNLVLSHSAKQDYDNCRRYYALARIKKIRSRRVIVPYVIGTACHAYKEAWYNGLDESQRLAALRKVFKGVDTSLMAKDEIVDLTVDQGRCEAFMYAYTLAHSEDRIQYPKLITEKEVRFEIIPGVDWLGFLDTLAQDAAGDWWVMETKTAGKAFVNKDYFDRVAIDNQVMGYMRLAAEVLGFMPKGIIYDVILKTQHRQRKGESLSAFVKRLQHLYVKDWKTEGLFARHELIVSPKAVDRWLTETRFIAAEIKAAHDNKIKVWPKNTGNCIAKYGACQYMSVCTTGQVDKMRFTIGKDRK